MRGLMERERQDENEELGENFCRRQRE
jgi:hypothetical protein